MSKGNGRLRRLYAHYQISESAFRRLRAQGLTEQEAKERLLEQKANGIKTHKEPDSKEVGQMMRMWG